MLARPGDLPLRGCAYEVKWDGFRALVSTEEGLDVRSRRGWAMAELVPELGGLPPGLVLDALVFHHRRPYRRAGRRLRHEVAEVQEHGRPGLRYSQHPERR